MKKLEDFQAEQIELKSIVGGGDPPTGYVCDKKKNTLERATVNKALINGTTCTLNSPDTYCDDNGNGIWDSGEPGNIRTGEGVISC